MSEGGFEVNEGSFDIAGMRALSNEVDPEPSVDGDVSDGGMDGSEGAREGRQPEQVDEQEPDTEAEDSDLDESESDDTGEEREDESDPGDGESTSKQGVIKAKSGDKEIAIPKDAVLPVKINGKLENMSVQDVINKASGVINVERENSKLGRERKRFESKQEAFFSQTRAVSENLELIAKAEDPLEIAEIIAELQGEDPERALEKMVKQTVQFFNDYKNMDPTQRKLALENRRYKRAEARRQAQETAAQRQQTHTQKAESLKSNLERSGFSMVDFQDTIDELTELNQNGEELGFGLDGSETITEDDIVRYMVEKDLHNRLTSAVEDVNPKLVSDADFVSKLKRVVVAVESLEKEKGVKNYKFTNSELKSLIESAMEDTKKAKSESLSKKVQKRTNSENISSRQQDEDEEEFGSIEELLNSRRNL